MNNSTLIVIPARGGSKGIPRKNLRALRGRPLISYAISTALHSRHGPDVVVTSDDAEILSIAAKLGAVTHRRAPRLAGDDVTLDSVVHDAVAAQDRDYAIVATVQPTSPLLATATLDAALDRIFAEERIDTLISATEDRHLRWQFDERGNAVPSYERRVNRQHLKLEYRETGGFLITRRRHVTESSRIGNHVEIFPITGPEAIDIDSPGDFNLCDWHLARTTILFVVTGHPAVGLGHVVNALTLANHLMRYEVSFLVDRQSELAERVIGAHNYPVRRESERGLLADIAVLRPDVVVNDRLDTSLDEMMSLKAVVPTIINFEDLGPGAELATLVFNAIYPERKTLPNHYFGPSFVCLRDDFALTAPRPISSDVARVLVTFGGTDPNNLTRRVLDAIGSECRRRGIALTAILGMGYLHDDAEIHANRVLRSVPDMANEMRDADVVFTSAGRTVFEIAAVGTPTIVLAQNDRELTHTFAAAEHGFVNLGLGTRASDPEILRHFIALLDDHEERRRMQERMRSVQLEKGVHRVVELIHQAISTR